MLPHLANQNPRVALMGTYIALYDDAFPGYRERVSALQDYVAAQLAGEIDVVLNSICTRLSDASAFVAQAESLGVDALVLLSLGYTTSLTVAEALESTRLPLILFNTQELREVNRAYRFQDLLDNHGMQGIQEIASVMVRRARPFAVVTGLLEQEDARAKLLDELAAAGAYRRIGGSRVGLIGKTMAGMGDAEVEPVLLTRVFGIALEAVSATELAKRLPAVKAEDIAAAREKDQQAFDIAGDLTREDHERSLRLELAMRRLVQDKQLAGLTFSFDQITDEPAIETVPFLAVTKLMAEGMAYAGEGDVLATAGGVITKQLCGETTFTEMYTMDFRANGSLHTHMAECNWAMARRDRRPRLLKRDFALGNCKPPAALAFSLEPGEVTLFDLTFTAEGQFHFIVFEGRVADFPPLDGLEIPNFKIVFDRDLRDVLDEYSLLGGSHHLSLAYGRRTRRYKALASYFDVPFSHIDT